MTPWEELKNFINTDEGRIVSWHRIEVVRVARLFRTRSRIAGLEFYDVSIPLVKHHADVSSLAADTKRKTELVGIAMAVLSSGLIRLDEAHLFIRDMSKLSGERLIPAKDENKRQQRDGRA